MAGSVAWRRGDIPDDVLHAVRGAAGHTAAVFMHQLGWLLAESGYLVRREVLVENRGDGHRGRVDLVAERDGCRVAIECDRKTARRKSIMKLGQVPATGRLVVCREAA